MSCSACLLNSSCISPCLKAEVSAGDAPVQVLFVVDSPGESEDHHGRPMMGQAGTFFRRFLGCGDVRYAIVHAVRCKLPEHRDPKAGEVLACRPHLTDDILRLNPQIVVALGSTAYYALTGKKTTISREMSRPQKIGERWLLTNYHPANHFSAMGRRDLTGPYATMFGQINSILTTGEPGGRDDVDIRVVTRQTIGQALHQLAQSQILALDVETPTTKKEPLKSSIYLPGQKILCIGVSTDLDQPTWVFPPEFYGQLRPYLTGRLLIGHNCLTGDSLVTLENGTKKTLGWMVTHKHPGPVLTINEETGTFELKRVIGWVNNGPRAWEDWLRIKVRGEGVLSLTRDHEVLTERGRLRAECVVVGDRILTQRPPLSRMQQDLLRGSLLGDGSLVWGKVVEVGPLRKTEGGSRYSGKSFCGSKIGPSQYCLEVEGNRNFFASGLSVSNCYFDASAIVWMLGWDEILDQPLFDTFLFHASRDRGYVGNGLEDLAVRYLGVTPWKHRIVEAIEEERKRRLAEDNHEYPTMEDVPFQVMAQYNGRDAYYTLCLFLYYRQQGWKAPKVYEWLLKPSIALFARMSCFGLGGDRERARVAYQKAQKAYRRLLKTLRRAPEIRWIEEVSGQEFNVRSQPHCVALVRATGAVVPLTKKGKPSTKKEVLKELGKEHPIWRRVQYVRWLQNCISKFLEPLQLHLQARDGRVHPTFHLAKMSTGESGGESTSGGAKTGRGAVSNPPMQQIEKTPLIREVFVPRPGYWLVELDYKGAEVVVFAWLAGCKKLLKWLGEGVDPYVELAAMVWGIPHSEVTSALRQEAKTLFLARLFGQGSRSFAARSKASEERVAKFFDFFDREFREIRQMHRKLIRTAESGIPINTPWDSPRVFDLNGKDRVTMLYNDPVQGTNSLNLVWKALRTEDMQDPQDFRMVMLTHDSMTAEIRKGVVRETLVKQVELMESTHDFPFGFRFPDNLLKVSIKLGRDLAHMRRVGKVSRKPS